MGCFVFHVFESDRDVHIEYEYCSVPRCIGKYLFVRMFPLKETIDVLIEVKFETECGFTVTDKRANLRDLPRPNTLKRYSVTDFSLFCLTGNCNSYKHVFINE